MHLTFRLISVVGQKGKRLLIKLEYKRIVSYPNTHIHGISCSVIVVRASFEMLLSVAKRLA